MNRVTIASLLRSDNITESFVFFVCHIQKLKARNGSPILYRSISIASLILPSVQKVHDY
jgi:hypothetical protein